jgi:signal transduction histidine kinase
MSASTNITTPEDTERPAAPDLPAPEALDFSHLTLSSTIADLPTHSFEVQATTSGQLVAEIFKQHPRLPGVIIAGKQGDKTITAVSRRRFLENVGRPYGIEVYLNRPIQVLVKTIAADRLILPAETTIRKAAAAALQRPLDLIYEPILVQFPEGKHRILDVYVLLLAQTQLLRLVNHVEQNRRQLAESLQETGSVLVSTLSLSKVTKRILKELDKVVTYERGAVLLRQEQQLVSLAKRGYPKDEAFKTLVVPMREGQDDIYCRLVTTQEPLILADITQEPSWQQFDNLPINHSWMGVPLIAQDQVIGMISLTRVAVNAFHPDEAPVVRTFASQAAIALENARLYEQVKEFNEHLEQMVDERTRELNQAYDILEKLDKTKSDFIKVSAHELRTPLTVVKGYTQVLQIKFQEDPETIRLVEGILGGVNRLHRIINSILDVARIDSNTLDLHLEDVSLVDVIGGLAEKLGSDLQQRKLALTTGDLSSLPPVYGDEGLLEKVFYSLLVNAIKYTPDGGEIVVNGRCLSLPGEPDAVEISIHDTGIGIQPDQLDLIFEKFYQTGELLLHSSGETKFMGGGPGLGLAIARGIVQAHNGRVWAESQGRDEQALPGSVFFVRLPLIRSG